MWVFMYVILALIQGHFKLKKITKANILSFVRRYHTFCIFCEYIF